MTTVYTFAGHRSSRWGHSRPDKSPSTSTVSQSFSISLTFLHFRPFSPSLSCFLFSRRLGTPRIAAFRIRASLSRNFHALANSSKKKNKTKRQQCSPELCGRRVDDKEIHGGGQRQLRVSRRGEIHRQPQETRDPGRSIQ